MNLSIKHYILVLIGSIFCGLSASAQDYEPYHWDEDRSLTTLTAEEEKYGLYYIQRSEQLHYAYDDGGLVCYITNHNIIRVNNDEALNKSNQLYIPMRNTIELTAVKARAIGKDGRVINFDQKNIKALEEDESGYKILAIEGAEVGGEIEYYYTRKTSARGFETRYVQFSYPVKSYDFTLKSPANLVYDFKLYNDTTKVKEDDDSEKFNLYSLAMKDIPALFEEGFSAYGNSKKRLEFKMAYNSRTTKARLNSWGDAGRRIYELVYNLTSQEEKEFGKFIKKVNYSGAPLEALKKYEHYIKTNFYFEENVGENGSKLDFILKNKYANSRGFTKLYVAILNKLGIDHEVVLTADRFESAFDPDFDTWNYLEEYLIYINQTEQFLSPKETPLRLGTIPDKYLETPGLFIKPEKIQDFIYPVAHIADIPAPSYRKNFDNMDITVSFSDDLEKNEVAVTRSYLGYAAEYYKAAMLFLEEENKKKLLDEVIKYLAPDADIDKVEVAEANTDYNTWHKPFTVKGDFTTNSYIESAGDIVLFKVGELIGSQSELYQEEERVLPVVNDFNRGYLRKIALDIPKGYTVQNPEDLIIKKQVYDGEKLVFNFNSSYTLNGQKLVIEIDEFYDQIYYPVEKFEAFREVINAAADWNKIVLVLEP